ncbi:hypothetical protein BJY04DRAFT_216383 [Aspergillus karnatakaensis]|uniref:uncharacterized protein n=1 Tax=Aspergillus karnatakaensis TaxID=1810916 RepID=UPI003CCD4C2A
MSGISTPHASMPSSQGATQTTGLTTPPQSLQEAVAVNPRKYIGYPELTKWLAIEGNGFMFRRFDRLAVRAILKLQDELVEIEKQIDAIDEERTKPESGDVDNGTLRGDPHQERKELLQKAYKYVYSHMQLRSRPIPSDLDRKSLNAWVRTHTKRNPDQGPVDEAELEYVNAPDLFTIWETTESPVRKLLDLSSHYRRARIWQREVHASLAPRFPNPYQVVTDDERIEWAAGVVTITIGALILIAPIWIFAEVEPLRIRLGVITVFITTFLVLLAIGTKWRPIEALAGTAA